jgi:S1-C subfamily serine protease
MKRVSLYSKSSRSRSPGTATAASKSAAAGAGQPVKNTAAAQTPPSPGQRRRYAARAREFISRHERLFLIASTALLSLALFIAYTASRPAAREITQKDIDAAVFHTLDKNVLPSPEAKAFRMVQRSVVRVRQLAHQRDQEGGADKVRGVGTGVVIVDKGVILTNLHVVAGADRVQVEFFDGQVSDASVISLQPENDLAVLQAKTVPDDLVPATLRSTRDLALGDRVVAVGFPFGIGPSASSGIVSGLGREYQSPEGKRILTNLIQFDAAANPGNSGGPLITMDGEVVGIVTAILNPGEQGFFIGIGFAVPIENAAAAAGESPF